MIGELKYVNDQWVVIHNVNLGPNCKQSSLVLVDLSSITEDFQEGKKVVYEMDGGKARVFLPSFEIVEPVISDDFQIGPQGAFEHEEKYNSWDEIFEELDKSVHSDLPKRVKYWLKNKFQTPKLK
jgi:hypothetical protein